MSTIEERVAFMEGQMSEQTHSLIEVRDAVRDLDQELRQAVRHLEQNVDRRLESMDGKISRQFIWVVGVQVTTLVAAIVGALLASS